MISKENDYFRSLVIILIIIHCIPFTTLTTHNFLDEEKIKEDLEYIQQIEHCDANQQIIENKLQKALHYLHEKDKSNIKIQEYQKIIDNFSYIKDALQKEYKDISNQHTIIYQKTSIHELQQKLLQNSNQLTDLSKKIKQEQDYAQSIHESLLSLPQQRARIKNILNNLEQNKILLPTKTITNPLEQAKHTALQAELAAIRSKITELELAQLSANNQQELSKLRILLLKKQYERSNNELEIIRDRLNHLYQKTIKKTIIDSDNILIDQNDTLPKLIQNQLHINHNLSIILNQQNYHTHNIISKKHETTSYILQVNRAFADLIEQAQWVNKSPALGETLRSQVSKLPKMPKFQQLDNDMAQIRTKRLQYEDQMNKLNLLSLQNKQDNGTTLTLEQKHIFEVQLNNQRDLLISLLNNYDIQILELTKLKIAYEQLKDALQKIQQATHRYLFWIADTQAIDIYYPVNIYLDIYKLLTNHTFYYQIKSVIKIIYNTQEIIISLIFCAIIYVIFHFTIYKHYQKFLIQSSKYVGKVHQDNFLITFINLFYSILISLPIPILWLFIGYSLNKVWLYPFISAIGDGFKSTATTLWGFLLNAYFASYKGLFTVHFGWSQKKIQTIFSYHYIKSIIIIISLMMAVNIFNNYNDREFYPTLGRLCFILLCIYLMFFNKNLKKFGLPLYLSNTNYKNNMINILLWKIIIYAPIIAAISCAFGYLFVAQTLLIRLEQSFFIWITLLIIYYIIRRWMAIQKRRIAFKRAKQKRIELLTLRSQKKLHSSSQFQINKFIFNTNNKKIVNLDTIYTQSLELIQSIITLIALLLMIILWSELRFAFSFLENIILWDIPHAIKGIENIQTITLNALLIIILIVIITIKTIRTLPSFLELTLLQYLNLTPGTGYAIIILTKYALILISILTGFSLIGIEWTKMQWLIAALSVGLGFGLQEIFANFVSGLIILFEKPIRIGDTITIYDFTGNVTKINTRATIITDWNHKEIIIPNKEFITKQFVNWSLSDTITRVVLKIPVPQQKIDTKKISKVLLNIVKQSTLALNTPSPEIYLVDLQKGLPIFEIRVYAAHTKLRIPLSHQINTSILEYYQTQGFSIPYLPDFLYKQYQL